MLDGILPLHSFFLCLKFFAIDKLHRPPGLGILRSCPGIMCFHPSLYIIRPSCIQGSILTAHHICIIHHNFSRSVLSNTLYYITSFWYMSPLIDRKNAGNLSRRLSIFIIVCSFPVILQILYSSRYSTGLIGCPSFLISKYTLHPSTL